jgi:PAS domain S-box-containing protein
MSVGQPLLQRVEFAVARILVQPGRPVETYQRILATMGEALDWELGALWRLDAGAERLRCAATWRASEHSLEFEALSARLTLASGEGLPGRVWTSGEPAWIVDAPEDRNFPRAEAAARAGLRAAFCFPLRSSSGVVGVIEFFARELHEPDEQLLASMTVLGGQIGEFIARRRAEDEVRARDSRLRAMVESSLDAVVAMDHRGLVLEWNPAAEATFGHTREEAIGKEMAELIVPPSLRAAHRRGLARFLETGDPVILDRRLDLTGLRADGSEFPVELTITRIRQPGPPVFTGYVRDITGRKRAEQALRDSRQRLVETADRERRRLERNLHDGAQQHLVAIALLLRKARDSLETAPEEAKARLEQAEREFDLALDELRELAQGIHPAVLTERGLVPALAALAERSAVPVRLTSVTRQRLPGPVEVGVYYTVAEALANVAKHAQATSAEVSVALAGERALVDVVDDGVGGAADGDGSGLRGLADRVDALGGVLMVESPRGGGTRVHAEIPVA